MRLRNSDEIAHKILSFRKRLQILWSWSFSQFQFLDIVTQLPSALFSQNSQTVEVNNDECEIN